jgi:DNA helicase II / ATP-dependent DNA helicase PcrA
MDELNPAQRRAVEAPAPLLVIAGAGSGKTNTLAHRVAHLVRSGADARRLLLLTFTRRAALEMTARARRIVAQETERPAGRRAELTWAGTFHAVANRLLRLHAPEVGLDPSFTVLDRSDSADLVDVVRHELGFSKMKRRFPQKGTCLSIYSRVVNAEEPLDKALERQFPWCRDFAGELKRLFAGYVEAKQRAHVLDYDDLLVYWLHLLGEPGAAEGVRRRSDQILVDEYQDTNALQAEILFRLSPDGARLTVVGDDAQSIYAFRAATVRNILDFPARCRPAAQVVTLEESYRSTPPILDAANAVIALAAERFTKTLFSRRAPLERPRWVTTFDETSQVEYVVSEILAQREAGVPLQKQAVLFRASHHSDALEVELARRNIPFVKYGGLKFLEAAHVKDTLSILRLVENPRDEVAAYRVAQLLPGIGPAAAQRVVRHLAAAQWSLSSLASFTPPAAAAHDWPELATLLTELAGAPWGAQLGRARRWYQPHLERLYDHALMRAQDLDQLEMLASQAPSRERFLSELALDPPQATGADAGPPLLDEDFLILSTIHSAKGQEWDAVFVLNAVDGCIPSDMATSTPAEIEEERRLLYVALTRARDRLHVLQPLRFYVHGQRRFGDQHVYAPRTRFVPDDVLALFERVAHGPVAANDEGLPAAARIDVAARLRAQWS